MVRLLLTAFLLASVTIGAGFAPNSGAALVHPTETDAVPATDDVKSWQVDRSHSEVLFRVRHLGLANVTGRFLEYEFDVRFDPANLATASASGTVQTASLDTDNERRDNHLRSDDFFNAELYPELTFVSKRVENVNGNSFQLVGDLTIRDVTREVTFEAELLGTTSLRGQNRAALEARATVNRMDFGLRWNNLSDTGAIIAGHNVTIILEISLVEAAV